MRENNTSGFTWSLRDRALWFAGSILRGLGLCRTQDTRANPFWRRWVTHLYHCCPLVTVETEDSSTFWFRKKNTNRYSLCCCYACALSKNKSTIKSAHPCVFWYQSALMRLDVRIMTLKPSSYHNNIIFLLGHTKRFHQTHAKCSYLCTTTLCYSCRY